VWIEPLFAEGKLWHGMRRFRTRTLEKVNAEALMIAAGQNIKRLLAFGGGRAKEVGASGSFATTGWTIARLCSPHVQGSPPETTHCLTLFNTLARFRNLR
jgi:hypothetical protein